MINIVKKELEFDSELKKKIEFVCSFCNTTPTIINGNIQKIERDKYASPLILPMIEMTYGRPTEMYSHLSIELLQREIEHLKKSN